MVSDQHQCPSVPDLAAVLAVGLRNRAYAAPCGTHQPSTPHRWSISSGRWSGRSLRRVGSRAASGRAQGGRSDDLRSSTRVRERQGNLIQWGRDASYQAFACGSQSRLPVARSRLSLTNSSKLRSPAGSRPISNGRRSASMSFDARSSGCACGRSAKSGLRSALRNASAMYAASLVDIIGSLEWTLTLSAGRTVW